MHCTEADREHIMYTDEYFEAPYEEYPITICGQTVILTNGELAAVQLSLPEKNREIIFLYFFGHYTEGNRGNVRTLPEYDRVSNPQDFTASA